MIEWGHSAIISALDGAVASFGPQTTMGASFEVEVAPVLASPIDGVGKRELPPDDPSKSAFENDYPGPLDNAADVEGNLVIMTDAAGLSGVTMARVAKESGAAALLVVNTDARAGDYIYSLEAESDEEATWAEANVDIPVIMVSLQAGNVITTALATEGMDDALVGRGGALPERVRVYAGGDRPFFEDVASDGPVIYLIHNMLTDEECDALVAAAEGKYSGLDDTVANALENAFPSAEGPGRPAARGVDRATLWKGALAGKAMRDIDERLSQVTGFPAEHLSDFQVDRHGRGSSHGPVYDVNAANGIVASVAVYLNDVPEGRGGETVYPRTEKGGLGVVAVRPTRGLAVVHHNTDDKHRLDPAALHAEAALAGGGYKYVARKYIHASPQPASARIALPLLALPAGGRLPAALVTLHGWLAERFGAETGSLYFGKVVTALPVLVVCLAVQLAAALVRRKLRGDKGTEVAAPEGTKAAAAAAKKRKRSKKSD